MRASWFIILEVSSMKVSSRQEASFQMAYLYLPFYWLSSQGAYHRDVCLLEDARDVLLAPHVLVHQPCAII
jgi:hypothetical protein